MKEYRKSKDCTAHYTSFDELRQAWNCKPSRKKTNNAEKLKEKQEKFLGTCPYCKGILSYITGNILSCKNEACKGKKIEKENKDGIKTIEYKPYFKLLNGKGARIAQNLFD